MVRFCFVLPLLLLLPLVPSLLASAALACAGRPRLAAAGYAVAAPCGWAGSSALSASAASEYCCAVLLRREGHKINHKRVLRLYREEGLKLRPKKRRKVASVQRVGPPATIRPVRAV